MTRKGYTLTRQWWHLLYARLWRLAHLNSSPKVDMFLHLDTFPDSKSINLCSYIMRCSSIYQLHSLWFDLIWPLETTSYSPRDEHANYNTTDVVTYTTDVTFNRRSTVFIGLHCKTWICLQLTVLYTSYNDRYHSCKAVA